VTDDELRATATEAASQLRALLTKIEAGDLTARPAMRHRIEGALTALEAVLGERTSLLDALDDDQ
jgi:hypothetical protein